MLRMFVDDSGINQEPTYCLAGFLASSRNWAKFSDEWDDELAAAPSIEYFKAAEWNGLRGQFGGWPRELADEKKYNLDKIICRNNLLGYSATIQHSDYMEVFGHSEKLAKSYPPYLILWNTIVTGICEYLSLRGNDDPIEFVFDTQEGHDKTVIAIWSDLKEMTPPHLRGRISGNPSFRSEKDKGFVALQAADMLAWQLRRSFWCRVNGKPQPRSIWHNESDARKIAFVMNNHTRLSLVGLSVSSFYQRMMEIGAYPSDLLTKIDRRLYSPGRWIAPNGQEHCLPRWD